VTDPGTGGLPARRLDQTRDYPPTGVQPGSLNVVRARLVIVSGAGVSGVFVYNGTPGLGNPPIVSITAGTEDPYGNTVVPGLDVTQGSITGTTISGNTITGGTISGTTITGGTVSGTTVTGSTFDGTDFIINSSGSFFYSGTPANGNLIASIASAGGTDGFGNTYLAGITSYDTANGNTAELLNGSVELANGGTGSVATVTNNGGQANYESTADGGSYDMGRLSVQIPGSTLSSVSFVPLGSGPVGPQVYSFRGWVQYANSVAADPPIFELTGPATSQVNYQFRNNSINAGAVTATAAIKNALSATFSGGNAVTTGQFLEVWGSVTFSGAGTFALAGACTLAADTVTITRGEFTIEPVTAT
jgi:hypothetical protein